MAERPDAPGPWSDERLDAAFAALVPVEAPPRVAPAVIGRLDDERARRWRRPRLGAGRFAVAAGVGVLAVALAIGSWAAPRGAITGSAFTVQPGPDGLSVFDAGEFRFTFPSAWSVTDTGAGVFSGGSSIAVLGIMPVPDRCGSGRVDINCVYEQPLDPGMIRVFVGTGSYRGTTVLDRPDSEAGTTTRPTVGGMPAILDDINAPDDYYLADLDLGWSIATPSSLARVVGIDVMAREPAVAEARTAAEALIASFAFTPPPLPLPAGSGPHLARLAIAELDRSFRQGFGQTTGENHYSCQPDQPGAERDAAIRFSAGGDLGGEVGVTCSWTVTAEGAAFWRVELHVDWTAAGRSGRYTELEWIDGAGQLAGSTWSGEGPPLVPPPSPTRAATPPPVESILGLPVMTVEEALVFLATDTTGREIAVRGWLGAPAIRRLCPAPDPAASPLLPRCEEEFVSLMRDPELLTGSRISPVGPSLNPLVRGSLDAEAPMPVPQDVIVIGHVNDPRASACRKADRAACAAAFVADRVVPVTSSTDIVAPPAPWLDGIGSIPRDTGEVMQFLRFAVDASPLLSIGVVDGARLAILEPALADIDINDPGPVWIVTVLGRRNDRTLTEVRTIVVPDSWIFPGSGSGSVYEIINGHANGRTWIID